MALFDSAADGLLTGCISTVGAIVLSVIRDRSKSKAFKDAWQTQAEELRRELRRAAENERGYYRTSLDKCQGEVARLNRLLTKRGREDD